MDVALAIELIYKDAQWGGSLTDNSKESFDALRWEDERTKPTWKQLQDAWADVPLNLETTQE
jgi:hypothetical protein